jgi:CsoR family transcriptional regulator, copper-sensing transcriptional repressor
MKEESREQVRRRANRISGQIAGIQRMIDEDRYCVDILNHA